jgi:hypothetical protein
VQARQTTDRYALGPSSGAVAESQCCTLVPSRGHLKRICRDTWAAQRAQKKAVRLGGLISLTIDDPSRGMGPLRLFAIDDSLVTGPRLTVKLAPVDGNLQFCCPLLPFLLGKFALALLEGGQFLLRRLKKAVAWCYCPLSVSRHLRTPSIGPQASIILKPSGPGKVRTP